MHCELLRVVFATSSFFLSSCGGGVKGMRPKGTGSAATVSLKPWDGERPTSLGQEAVLWLAKFHHVKSINSCM